MPYSSLMREGKKVRGEAEKRSGGFLTFRLPPYLLTPNRLLRYVLNQTQHVAGIAILIVVPSHDFNEG